MIERLEPIPAGLSNRIANMAFICACMVVAIHLSYDRQMLGGFVHEVIQGFMKSAVPGFFLISGFFLYGKVKSFWGVEHLTQLKKRVKSLVVPFFAWSVLWAAYVMPLIAYDNYRKGMGLACSNYVGWWNIRWLGLDFTSMPALGLLWYVRCLIILAILSPLLFLLLDRFGWKLLVLIAVLAFIAPVLLGCGFFENTMPLYSVLFFLVGGFFRKHPLRINVGNWYVLPIAMIIFASMVIADKNHLAVGSSIKHVLMPICLYVIWRMVPERRWPEWLVSSTFAVYLMHMFFMVAWGCVFGRKTSSVTVLLAQYVVVLSLSVGAYNLMRRLLPRFSSLLLGGRI